MAMGTVGRGEGGNCMVPDPPPPPTTTPPTHPHLHPNPTLGHTRAMQMPYLQARREATAARQHAHALVLGDVCQAHLGQGALQVQGPTNLGQARKQKQPRHGTQEAQAEGGKPGTAWPDSLDAACCATACRL